MWQLFPVFRSSCQVRYRILINTNADRPQGVVLSCRNCTIAGDVDIIQGSFSVSKATDNALEKFDDVVDNLVDFFTNGTVEVIANGLFTHMELGINISTPEEVPFNVSLPPIPLTPFAVCGAPSLVA